MNSIIKIERIKRNIKQEDLSKRLGSSRCKLSALENGNFKNLTYPLMIEIAKVFNCTVQELFFKDED